MSENLPNLERKTDNESQPKGTKKQPKKIHKTHYNQIVKTQGQGILKAERESDSSQKREHQ